MSQTPFRRSLIGDMTGVAVNIPVDTTGIMLPSSGAGVVAIVGKFSRGRIDKPFLVDRSQIRKWLGKPESMRVSATNEAYVQAYEAALRGASGIVVSRLVSNDAVNGWIVAQENPNNLNELKLSVHKNNSKPTATDFPNMVFAFRLKNAIQEGVIIQVKYNLASGNFSVVIREVGSKTELRGDVE